MTLSEANEYIRQMDTRRHETQSTPHMVKVKIDYMWGDTSDRYWLPLEIGSGRGGLLEQMEQRLTYYRTDPQRIMQEFDFSKVDVQYQEFYRTSFLPFVQTSIEDLHSNLLPYFRNHCNITELKQKAEALIPGMGEGRQAQFKVKLEEQVAALRQQVNSGEMKQMPQQVQLKQNSPQRATQDKPPQARQSVKVRLEQIKAKQGTQARQPDRTNHTPSRPKLK